MQRVDEQFIEKVKATDLRELDAVAIDTLWEPLMYEQQMAAARHQQYLKLAIEAKYEHSRERYAKTAEEFDARERELDALQVPFREVWEERNGWQRVFLVVNHDGHFHKERNCPTCFATTQFAWVPTLSDRTEDQIIAEVGPQACTVCWPNAPVHPAFIQGLKDKEAEEAAKAAKECPGSGKQALNADFRYATPRGTCPVCKRGITPTSRGKVRKHKTPLQEKIEEQDKRIAKETKTPAAFNRIHALALRVDAAIDLLDAEDPARAVVQAEWADQIKPLTAEVLGGLVKQRERRAKVAR
jgi:hypothetical protein